MTEALQTVVASPRELERRGEIFAKNRLSGPNIPVSRVSLPCNWNLSPKNHQSVEYSPWPPRRPVFSGRCYFKVLDKLDKGASGFVRSDSYTEHASVEFHVTQKLRGKYRRQHPRIYQIRHPLSFPFS